MPLLIIVFLASTSLLSFSSLSDLRLCFESSIIGRNKPLAYTGVRNLIRSNHIITCHATYKIEVCYCRYVGLLSLYSDSIVCGYGYGAREIHGH